MIPGPRGNLGVYPVHGGKQSTRALDSSCPFNAYISAPTLPSHAPHPVYLVGYPLLQLAQLLCIEGYAYWHQVKDPSNESKNLVI